jgi:hypothetical protein
MTKNSIGGAGQHGVGQDNFFEKTERHQKQAPKKTPGLRFGRLQQLRQKISRADDWSRDQLREKRDREHEIAQRFRGLHDATIDVERVGQGVEGVEGNSDRQEDVEMRRLINDADARHQPLKIFEQEISVFEKAEHAQVGGEAGHEPEFARARSRGLGDAGAEPKIEGSSGKKQGCERRIPRAIKKIAREHEEVFARGPVAQTPIRRHDNGEENDERERVEEHVKRFP